MEGLRKVAKRQLDCMEVEFTYGVRMPIDTARKVGKLAKQNGIILSVHAPYYINLASDEAEKVEASKKRILDSCHRADLMGAKNVVFHAGFYQSKTAKKTYSIIKQAIVEIQKHIIRMNWKVLLCPEVTGKPSQFGSIEEILKLMEDTGCGITVDFAHLYARQQGNLKYEEVLDRLPERFHAHFSGIEFGPKGEKKHTKTTKKFFEPLAKLIIQRKLDVTIINESPQPYKDAVMMKKVLKKLQGQLRYEAKSERILSNKQKIRIRGNF